MQPGIQFIEYYLPTQTLSNESLAKLYPEWTADKIFNKTGIRSRHIAAQQECVSDMAEKAVRKLFSQQDINPQAIDFIILITENPDYILPPTACILHDRLGLPSTVGAIDVNLGCSGYIYGLKLAKSLLLSKEAQNILLITGDAYSKRINPMDKSARTIFGDAATVSLITIGPDVSEIGTFDVGTDGSGFGHFIIPAGGTRLPINAETSIDQMGEDGNIRSMNDIYMNGPEIMFFSITTLPQTINNILTKHNLTLQDINWFVFHQANQYILRYLQKKIGIPEEKFIIDLEDIGNTVSSSIPLALKRMQDKQMLFKKNDLIMLVGFGVGLSWGATIIKFGGRI